MIHEAKPDLDAYVLEHYGVKGMRWGQRKERSGSSGKGKKIAIGAAAVAGTAGAAFVAYKLSQGGGVKMSSLTKPAASASAMTKVYKDAGMSAKQIAEAQKLAAAWG